MSTTPKISQAEIEYNRRLSEEDRQREILCQKGYRDVRSQAHLFRVLPTELANLDCSCTFKTNEGITKVITAPPQPENVPEVPPEPAKERQTLGRYGSAFRQVH